VRFEDYSKKLQQMEVRVGSATDKIRNLILEKELLQQPASSEMIRQSLYEIGVNVPITSVISIMRPFQVLGVVKRKKIDGKISWFGSWHKENTKSHASFPFNAQLIKSLGKDFKTEFEDLHRVYGLSGTCTAFLLRKILEKATFLALVKTGTPEKKLKDSSGNYVGLEALLNIASTIKIKGIPVISPKTVKKVLGIKFLGDVSAHNYLVNVATEDLVPQLPFITIALREISRFLA
jgi:hypothetical protein